MHVLRRSPLPRTLAVTVAAGLLAIVISLLLMLGPLATGQDSTVALHPAQQMSGVTQPAVTQSATSPTSWLTNPLAPLAARSARSPWPPAPAPMRR